MTAVQFYYNHVCPFAYRVRLALAEKAIPHKAHVIDLQNIPVWYAEISPTGKVPLLKMGDDVVWESTVITSFWKTPFLIHLCCHVSPSPAPMPASGSNTATAPSSQTAAAWCSNWTRVGTKASGQHCSIV